MKWIFDKVPEKDGLLVLGIAEFPDYYNIGKTLRKPVIVWHDWVSNCWWDDQHSDNQLNIICWMPIPDCPETGEDK